MSKRSEEWIEFSDVVKNHIEEYTVKQYGDKPDDLVEQWSKWDCLRQIEKYIKRHGANARSDQDGSDLLKIAHYAQIAWTKGA